MKLSYSGNYSDFNKLVKRLNDKLPGSHIVSPGTTYVNGMSPANMLSNVYHELHHLNKDDGIMRGEPIGLRDKNLSVICKNIRDYLEKLHKSPYED